MARTSKSRGASAFQMRSGNRPSPKKFLGALGGLVKGSGSAISNLLGGGTGAQKVGKFFGGGGLFGAAGRAISGDQNLMTRGRGGGGGPAAIGGNYASAPMAKRESPYTKTAGSPMKITSQQARAAGAPKEAARLKKQEKAMKRAKRGEK